VLTELTGGRHRFVAEAGTPTGQALLDRVGAGPAPAGDVEEAERAVLDAAGRMGRTLDLDGLAEDLVAAAEDEAWAGIAERCLACGNCTMVCPTCFCSTVEDVTDLSGEQAERWRRWDSCFTVGFSYLHGGSVRSSVASRYRQWATHKLATWQAQFGTAGCVGCGRCITWCPVGIDLPAEVSAIRSRRGARC
jgi:ferredoxin